MNFIIWSIAFDMHALFATLLLLVIYTCCTGSYNGINGILSTFFNATHRARAHIIKSNGKSLNKKNKSKSKKQASEEWTRINGANVVTRSILVPIYATIVLIPVHIYTICNMYVYMANQKVSVLWNCVNASRTFVLHANQTEPNQTIWMRIPLRKKNNTIYTHSDTIRIKFDIELKNVGQDATRCSTWSLMAEHWYIVAF